MGCRGEVGGGSRSTPNLGLVGGPDRRKMGPPIISLSTQFSRCTAVSLPLSQTLSLQFPPAVLWSESQQLH